MTLDLHSIRTSHPLPGVVAATSKLVRRGDEYVCCCPLHNERTPSFTIFDGGHRWHCFGCGAGGDVLDFVQQLHGVGLVEAAERLTGGNLPSVDVRPLPSARPDDGRNIELARSMWCAASSPQGTLADVYLRHRAVTLPLPDCLRFARLRHPDTCRDHPVALFLVTGGDNIPCGVQRIYLADDGKGKLSGVGAAKLSLGRLSGGAIRLTPAAKVLALAEGPETALSFMQIEGLATWATCGATNLPRVELPSGITDIVIAADRGSAGQRAASQAITNYGGQGKRVRVVLPMPDFDDFNDELQAKEADDDATF